ncbi:MAG: HNH endonuclease [Dehalococcoidia bacterium]
MNDETKELICDFVDYLLPEITPYETSLYLYLLRHSFLKNESYQLRIGKRTMADGYGKGARGIKTNYQHMTEVIKRLEDHGCITIGDTNREGTLYTVIPPCDIPLVQQKMAITVSQVEEENYFNDSSKRLVVFDRDNWTCQYCGEKVTKENATLDHYIPQVKGGTHEKANLRTCCLICNGVKSGKPYDEAAPSILKSILERKQRIQK